jgi:cell division protein FtsX
MAMRIWLSAALALVALVGCDSASKTVQRVEPRGTVTGRQTDAEVFLKPTATAAEVAAVGDVLGRSRVVQRFTFVSKPDAEREFTRLFHDFPPEVVESTACNLPASFRLALVKGVATRPLKRTVEKLPGVEAVEGIDDPTVGGASVPSLVPAPVPKPCSATGERVSAS